MTREIKTHKIDAKDQILGRLATKAANLLRGKGKVNFVYYQNIGDKVEIINAQQVKLTGRKIEEKQYTRHSGYLGNIKHQALKDLLEKKPEKVIRKAVYGMLPKNKLRREWMKNLKVYKDKEE